MVASTNSVGIRKAPRVDPDYDQSEGTKSEGNPASGGPLVTVGETL